MVYVDGFVAPVKNGDRDAYIAFAEKVAIVFREHGATRVVETWGDDLHHGKQTDFYRSVAAEEGEGIVFAWIEWPSKEVRDAGMAKVMADPRAIPPGSAEVPFDAKRMIYGGFAAILDA